MRKNRSFFLLLCKESRWYRIVYGRSNLNWDNLLVLFPLYIEKRRSKNSVSYTLVSGFNYFFQLSPESLVIIDFKLWYSEAKSSSKYKDLKNDDCDSFMIRVVWLSSAYWEILNSVSGTLIQRTLLSFLTVFPNISVTLLSYTTALSKKSQSANCYSE